MVGGIVGRIGLRRRRTSRRQQSNVVWGGGFVRVGYYVLLIVVGVECGDGIMRAYRGTEENVAIEYNV